MSLIGFLFAIEPLSTDSISVLGIGFSVGEAVLKGVLTLVLAYLTNGFVVRVVTGLAAAGPSRVELRLRERINRQTGDIAARTMKRLTDLLGAGPNDTFHSQSFESLPNDTAPKGSVYRAKMLKNAP